MKANRKQYSEKFKRSSGVLFFLRKTSKEVTQDLGIADSNLRHWCAQYCKRENCLPQLQQGETHSTGGRKQKAQISTFPFPVGLLTLVEISGQPKKDKRYGIETENNKNLSQKLPDI